VLGAAVIDDIVGLVILAVVADLVTGSSVEVGHVAKISVVAILFFVVALLVGMRVAPPAFGIIERIKSAGALGVFGISFAFALAILAKLVGSALIIGAFAAGLVLFVIPQKQEIERSTTTIGHFFVPIFFATVGAAVDLRALANARSLAIGLALIVCGIAGKGAAGYVPWWFRGRKLLVGTAMVPRGEVGLIFAQMGLSTGAIDAGLFGAIMLMVLTTTLVTPPMLARVSRAATTDVFRAPPAAEDRPGDGGIDDLVAGASQTDSPDEQARSTRSIRRQ
jgi:Kef-type K+ transport system membrane component KefB